MNRRVGLDLDGTLIDTRARHETALRQAAEALGVKLPTAFPASYYEQKRNGSPGRDILLRHKIPKADEIAAAWVRIVEEDNLLALDAAFPHVFEKMRELLAAEIEFYVCTARQHCDRVVRQIAHLGLGPFVKEVFVAQPRPRWSPGATKAKLTGPLGLQIIVGDSEADLEWASKLGARFIAVSCGLRSRDFWAERMVTPHETTASALEAVLAVLTSGKPSRNQGEPAHAPPAMGPGDT